MDDDEEFTENDTSDGQDWDGDPATEQSGLHGRRSGGCLAIAIMAFVAFGGLAIVTRAFGLA